jgi:hypothetical protein
MPTLKGTVLRQGAPADNAYVQLQNLKGDFQAEVRTDAEGKFTLHPVPGRWRLVSWVPGGGKREEQEVEVGSGEVGVEISLA